MIAVALAALWAGGALFWLLASAAALLMMTEWAGLMGASRWAATGGVVLLGAALAAVRLVGPSAGFNEFAGGFGLSDVYALAAAVALAAALLLAVATLRPSLGAGLLYAGLPAIGLLLLRDRPDGFVLTLWTLAVVWATDIGAYFAGRTIGGRKLSPTISPNKTWAGLFGGIAAALGVGALIASSGALPRLLVLLGAPMAVLAQMGDLFESWLKRRAGVKDSGRLLPGHGGVLDRLDGLVPVAAAMALLTRLDWL